MHSIISTIMLSMALVHSATSLVLPAKSGVAVIEKRGNAFVEDSAVSAFTPYTSNKVPNPEPILLNYLLDTEKGLNQLNDAITNADQATAQNIYTTLSGYFDAILFYTDKNKKGCNNAGPGHQIDSTEAHTLINTIWNDLNALATHDSADADKALKDVCDARNDFFNSGLREYIFHNQNSGTGN